MSCEKKQKIISNVCFLPYIKLPADRIEAGAPMEKYGINSIMIMHLTNQLEKVFGSLSKTLFFEYQDIKALTGYFLESHHRKLTEVLGIQEEATTAAKIIKAPATEIEQVKSIANSRKYFRLAPLPAGSPEETKEQDSDIAVIGVSGRYPQAEISRNFGKICEMARIASRKFQETDGTTVCTSMKTRTNQGKPTANGEAL